MSDKGIFEYFLSDSWVDSHSVHCYFCEALIDEREAIRADKYNGDDGGMTCQSCADEKVDEWINGLEVVQLKKVVRKIEKIIIKQERKNGFID